VIGFIGRLDFQKGADLIQEAVHSHGFLEQDIQMIMLGSGDPVIEEWMKNAVRTSQNKVELSPRGASCEPNHRCYGPGMEGWEAALESCCLAIAVS